MVLDVSKKTIDDVVQFAIEFCRDVFVAELWLTLSGGFSCIMFIITDFCSNFGLNEAISKAVDTAYF